MTTSYANDPLPNFDASDQLDFPNNPQLNQTHTGKNGVNYYCAQVNPTVWLIVEQGADQGQRLWQRDPSDSSIYPIFAGDDVDIIDEAGNATTIIKSGGRGETAGIKSDNYFFSHLPLLE